MKHKKILVVGGGTAGWMVANLFAVRWPEADISLLESSEIGIIGVGEGSTPQLKLFFDAINVSEEEWMPSCNATFKNGISFHGWSHAPGYQNYFHPFPAQTDAYTTPVFFNNIRDRIQGKDAKAHPDRYFLATYLAQQGLGPLPAESFPFDVAYGYHFDSGLLGKFLADKAMQRGVRRIIGTLTDVQLSEAGAIASVLLEDGRLLDADFFVDCTGFSSLLLQGALKVPFISFANNLFNDAAVVMPTEVTASLPPETRSTALSSGWAWKIPLRNRYGNGYVYSTQYLSADAAEFEFRQHLGLLESGVQAKHLSMKVGRTEQHWSKNCLAVGLAQGFIEPLEATALYLVFETVYRFMKYYEAGSFSNQHEREFNADINEKFDGVRDYIVCHYKVNQRKDSRYWLDNADNKNISNRLEEILKLWRTGGNFVKDMADRKLEGSYQAESWACLLAGYGYFPPMNPTGQGEYNHRHNLDKLTEFVRRCGLNFKLHQDLLKN